MMILWLVAKQRLVNLHNNIVATKDDRCIHKFCRAHLAEPLVYLRGITMVKTRKIEKESRTAKSTEKRFNHSKLPPKLLK